MIAARDRQAAELHKRCREAKEELKETRSKGDEASRAAKISERQEGKMARDLKKANAQIEKLTEQLSAMAEEPQPST